MKPELLRHLLREIEQAEHIFRSDLDWEDKYDIIFGMKLGNIAGTCNLSVKWCDPDCGYDDDVIAYMSGVSDLKDKVLKLLDVLPEDFGAIHAPR